MVPLSTTIVVVGAAGQVGSALLAALAERDDLRLIAVDLGSGDVRRTCDRSLGDVWVAGNVAEPSPEIRFAFTMADVVVLALPESVAEAAAPHIFAELAPGALVVDTLSVKSSWFEQIAEVDGSFEMLSINPMFAPALGFEGRPIAAVDLRPGQRSRWFMDMLEGFGSTLVMIDAAEHDVVTASVQVATHAAILSWGLAIEAMGHDVARLTPLFTPPHRTMMAMLARICAGDSHVYHDIQHHNPHAARARQAIIQGLLELDDHSVEPDAAGFSELTGRLQTMMGDGHAAFASLCAQLFSDASSDSAVKRAREPRPCAYRHW